MSKKKSIFTSTSSARPSSPPPGAGPSAATRYQANPVHRNGAPGKTQWKASISIQDEENIMRVGEKNGWVNGGNIFSLRLQSATVAEFLDSDEVLNFAHFTGVHIWHGWPANPKRSPVDLPSYSILMQWVSLKYTTRARIAKLRGLQRCAI